MVDRRSRCRISSEHLRLCGASRRSSGWLRITAGNRDMRGPTLLSLNDLVSDPVASVEPRDDFPRAFVLDAAVPLTQDCFLVAKAVEANVLESEKILAHPFSEVVTEYFGACMPETFAVLVCAVHSVAIGERDGRDAIQGRLERGIYSVR